MLNAFEFSMYNWNFLLLFKIFLLELQLWMFAERNLHVLTLLNQFVVVSEPQHLSTFLNIHQLYPPWDYIFILIQLDINYVDI